jgi:hypothetical protein
LYFSHCSRQKRSTQMDGKDSLVTECHI